jgi:transcriptional regulator GlxA family with amidase domain
MRVGFVLVPRSSLMTFSCAREAFRLENERSHAAPFRYATIGVEEGLVEMDGAEKLLPDVTLDRSPAFDIIFVVSGINAVEYRHSQLERWLRARSRTGAVIAPLGCATVLAARAGLLNGHRCVTHWTLYERFRTEFPKIHLVEGLFSIDGSVKTAAGGLSAFELGLALVQKSSTAEIVTYQAEIAIHPHPRVAAEHQRTAITWRYGVQDARLVRAIELMEAQINRPAHLLDLAAAAAVSVRQLERLCLSSLGRSPRTLYQEIRLRHAQTLLRTTRTPIAEIALVCGFADASHLTRRYRELFGGPPSGERRVSRKGNPDPRA